MALEGLSEVKSATGSHIACQRLNAKGGHDGAAVVWLGGFKSDMTGTKAEHLYQWAKREGRAFVRFDYRGHGRSAGDFEQLGIGDWLDDVVQVLDTQVDGPALLVGSSMGGWLALLAALRRPEKVAGLVLIAPAADFTRRLMWDTLSPEARHAIEQTGRWERPSAYGDGPYVITRTLIESGDPHLLLHAPIAIDGPVRILHGMEDPDVPWRLSLEIAERLESADVRLTFVKAGDHRLSTPSDLALLEREVAACLAEVG